MNTVSEINENGVFNINNISYSIGEGAIEFKFTYRNEGFKSAFLQLPNTGDSQHVIDGEDFDGENNYHVEVFETLRNSYYADFKDIECAKASIVCCERVLHVESINNRYAAFCESGTIEILQEGYASSYYNVFYFEKADFYDDDASLRVLAKKEFFKRLKRDLEHKLRECNSNENADGMLGDFMRKQFGLDWQENDIAQDFYEMTGCDCRNDAISALETNS